MRVNKYYIYFLVDDAEMAVKVNAVIYAGRDQSIQMADRKMEEQGQPNKTHRRHLGEIQDASFLPENYRGGEET